MSVLVDTGLFYALQNTRAQHHGAAKNALSVTNRGLYGRPFTSEYVFDEVVTLVRSHRGYREAKVVGDRILGADEYPQVYDLLSVGKHEFEAALDAFERYDDHPLSFTDATTIALMDAHRIDSLLSFDADFDGVVDRLDPTEVEER